MRSGIHVLFLNAHGGVGADTDVHVTLPLGASPKLSAPVVSTPTGVVLFQPWGLGGGFTVCVTMTGGVLSILNDTVTCDDPPRVFVA